MADILYTYKNQVYANITNRCNCSCTFCIRSHQDSVGDAETLWHKEDPSAEEIKAAMDAFDFTGYDELVYCGYGEPTCRLDVLLETAKYARENYGVSIRINTNGLGCLEHGRDIIPDLVGVVLIFDALSISLNSPAETEYNKVTRPRFSNAFPSMLKFAKEAHKVIPSVQLSIVDVLPKAQIAACKELAASLGVPLKIRKYS